MQTIVAVVSALHSSAYPWIRKERRSELQLVTMNRHTAKRLEEQEDKEEYSSRNALGKWRRKTTCRVPTFEGSWQGVSAKEPNFREVFYSTFPAQSLRKPHGRLQSAVPS